MAKYALVSPTDVIIEFRNYSVPPDAVTESAIKPRLLPVALENIVVDTVSEVREGPVYTVRATDVLEVYTKRNKTAGEIEAMRQAKISALKAETFTRTDALMSEQEQRLYACLGVDMARSFGVYANWPQAAKNVHDPLHTKWLTARDVFQVGVTKLGEIRALTTAAEIAAYDVTAGW